MRLGLGVPLLEAALRPRAVEIRAAATGHLLAEAPLAGAAEERYGAPYCVLARPALHRLLTGAANRAGALIRYASEVEGFGLEREGVVVHIAGTAPIAAAGLVGADGLWSRARAGLGQGVRPVHSGRIAWRATVSAGDVPRSFDGAAVVTAWLAPRAHGVTYAIDAEGTINVVVVTEGRIASEGWDVDADSGELVGLAANCAPALRDLMGAGGHWRAWPLFETRPPMSFGTGAMALVGDAAHPMLPFAAQGAAMAIEDAWVLAEAAGSRPTDLSAAFRAYERTRAGRVGRVGAMARRNGRAFHLGWPLALIRNRALAARSGAGLLARLDWLYGGGPVARAEAAAHSGAT